MNGLKAKRKIALIGLLIIGVMLVFAACKGAPRELNGGAQEKKMFLDTLVVGDLESNCYIIGAEEHAREAIVIDPGDNAGLILDTLAAESLDLKYIILTHAHWDHISAALELKEKTGAKVAIHKADVAALNQPNMNLASWLGEKQNGELKPDIELEDGQVLTFGDLEAHILHTPGHTPGSISVRLGDSIFTGDLLFYGSIGRSDFAGGSYDQLIQSVKSKILVYPDNIRIYPGHGPATTIGGERRHNPYLTGL